MRVLIIGDLKDFPKKMDKYDSNENLTEKMPYRKVFLEEVNEFLKFCKERNFTTFEDLYKKFGENYNNNSWVEIDSVLWDTYPHNPNRKFSAYRIISTNEYEKKKYLLLVDAIITNDGVWVEFNSSGMSITDWINKIGNLVNAKNAQFALCDCTA